MKSQNEKIEYCPHCGPGTVVAPNGSKELKYRKVKRWLCKECGHTFSNNSYQKEFKSKIYDSILWKIMKPSTENLGQVAEAMMMGPKTLNKYIYRHGTFFLERYAHTKLKQESASFSYIKLRAFRLDGRFDFRLSHTRANLINWFEESSDIKGVAEDTELIDFLKKKKFDKYIMESSSKKIFLARLAFFIRLSNSVQEYQRTKSIRKTKDKMTAQD